MSSLLRATIACLPLALALACDPGPGEDPNTLNLDGRTFLSQSVTEDGTDRVILGGGTLRLQFAETSEVSASAGCNTMGGSYRIEDGALVLDGMYVTEIGCDAPRHEQDDWYFGFVGSSPTLEIDGDSLVLERDGTRIEYLDEELATPDIALVGPTWTVNTIIDGEVAMGAAWPTPATLVFGEATVEVSTGCNTGSGAYAVVGDTIEFDGVSTTKLTCPDELSTTLETALLGVVQSAEPVSWEIDVASLSLLRADGSGVILSGE